MGSHDRLRPHRTRRVRFTAFKERLVLRDHRLIWGEPSEVDLHMYEPVKPFFAKRAVQRLFEHAGGLEWHGFYWFYCRVHNRPEWPVHTHEHDAIADWLQRELDERMGRLTLLRRKPLRFTGRFLERTAEPPEEAPDEGPPWIQLQLKEGPKQLVGEVDFELKLEDGTTRTGTLDANGFAHLEDVPDQPCTVRFPNLKRKLFT